MKYATIQFLGGAGTGTGLKYLITYKNRKILVDCGKKGDFALGKGTFCPPLYYLLT